MSADARKPCPVCGEQIALTARKCRFCGEFFESPDAARSNSKPSAQEGYNLFADTVTGVNVRWSDIPGGLDWHLGAGLRIAGNDAGGVEPRVAVALDSRRSRGRLRRPGAGDIRQRDLPDDLSRAATSPGEARLTSGASRGASLSAAHRHSRRRLPSSIGLCHQTLPGQDRTVSSESTKQIRRIPVIAIPAIVGDNGTSDTLSCCRQR